MPTQKRHTHPHPGAADPAGARRLAWVLALTVAYALAEVLGGWLANSLALLADAGHMVTDVMALALALVAARWSRRPPDASRTYGYRRVEILAALFNGVGLILVALAIVYEAWQRLDESPQIDVSLMAAIAAGGLVVNLVAAGILHGGHARLNVRAAYLHVVGDLLGSIGALIAAGLIWRFDWIWADAVASAVICAIIVFSAVRLVLESVNVLLEGAPSGIRTEEVARCLLETPGVCDVHDLHLWSLGAGSPLLTAHLVMDHSEPADRVLRAASDALLTRFGVTHSTLQIEPPDYNIVQQLTPEVAPSGSTADD
ncbi:MAG TPA: cation diffusion facilitator family transporter [Candidatus Polarisedimenticolaceae bacterium]|nr:cation diffusion facilitator family transporter [Candidatus Polarisedimenticolaceae bacterium]